VQTSTRDCFPADGRCRGADNSQQAAAKEQVVQPVIKTRQLKSKTELLKK